MSSSRTELSSESRTPKMPTEPETVNDRAPNWRKDGRLYLKRCFACEPEFGRENWGIAVATGCCAWCGWDEPQENTEDAG